MFSVPLLRSVVGFGALAQNQARKILDGSLERELRLHLLCQDGKARPSVFPTSLLVSILPLVFYPQVYHDCSLAGNAPSTSFTNAPVCTVVRQKGGQNATQ